MSVRSKRSDTNALIKRLPEMPPSGARSTARRDYVEQHERGSMERQLAVLMAHVGLTGVDASELGGNHPVKVQQSDGSTPKISEASGEPSEDWRINHYNMLQEHRVKEPSEGSAKALVAQLEDPEKLAASIKAALAERPETQPGKAVFDPIGQARQVQTFMFARGQTPKEAAHELGFSRSHVLNLLRLLTLPESIQAQVTDGRLSAGHGRAIAKMRDPEAIARLIIRRGLSVRQAETLARRLRYIRPDGSLTNETAIPYTHITERFMEDALGCKVRFKDRAGRGEICIAYSSPEQARSIVDKLTGTYFGIGAGDIGGEGGQ